MGSGFRRNDNSVSGVDGNFSSKRVGAHLHHTEVYSGTNANTKAAGLMLRNTAITAVGVSGDVGWMSGTFAIVDAKGTTVDTGKYLSVHRRARRLALRPRYLEYGYGIASAGAGVEEEVARADSADDLATCR